MTVFTQPTRSKSGYVIQLGMSTCIMRQVKDRKDVVVGLSTLKVHTAQRLHLGCRCAQVIHQKQMHDKTVPSATSAVEPQWTMRKPFN